MTSNTYSLKDELEDILEKVKEYKDLIEDLSYILSDIHGNSNL